MKNKKLKELYRSYMAYCTDNNRAFYIKDNFVDFIEREKLGYNAYEVDIYFNKILDIAKDYTSKLLPHGSNTNEQITITRRKRHPVRDLGAKKVGVPAVAVAIGSAITYGAIMAANMVAGTGFLIPVTANTAMNVLSTASVGLMGGLLLTPAIIATKNAITKKYYSAKYGNVSKILKKLNKQHSKALKKAKTLEEKNKLIAEHAATRYEKLATEIDAKLAKLETKISKSTEKILSLRTGSKLTAPFRAIARTMINIVNRNRIHHVQKCANDLMIECIGGKPNSQQNGNLISKMIASRNATPIYASLTKISDFVSGEIEKSKTYALNNKKDKNLIENIDIYANMAIELQDIKRPRKTSKRDHIDNVAKDLFFGKTTLLGSEFGITSNDREYLPEPLTTIIDVKKESDSEVKIEVTPDNKKDTEIKSKSTVDTGDKKDSMVDEKNPLVIDLFSRSGFDKIIYETKKLDKDSEKTSSTSEDLEKFAQSELEDFKKAHEDKPLSQREIESINKTIDEINKSTGSNIPHYENIVFSPAMSTFDNLTVDDDAYLDDKKDVKTTEIHTGDQVSFFDDKEEEKHSESDDIKIDTTTPPKYDDDEETKTNKSQTPVTKTPTDDKKIIVKPVTEEPKKENLVVVLGGKYSIKVDESLKTQINVTCNGKKAIIKKFKTVNGISVPKNADELKTEKAQAILDIIS
ncbi:MAG: hypothetical protein ACLRFL_00110 [Clostridia bacterium]